jgi:hypothetical protein
MCLRVRNCRGRDAGFQIPRALERRLDEIMGKSATVRQKTYVPNLYAMPISKRCCISGN